VLVPVGVAERAAVHHHGMIEQAAIAVLNGFHFFHVIAEKLDVEGINLRDRLAYSVAVTLPPRQRRAQREGYQQPAVVLRRVHAHR